MPIIDLSPVGHRTYDPQKKIIPTYLVLCEDPTIKTKLRKYLAVRLDDMQNFVKIVGLEITIEVDKIQESYQEIVNTADKQLYRELMLPWQRIITIQNLIFRAK